ncbi:MAG: hypothetical protein WCK77_17405 [Verrucomicrobiota bacterium]
MRNQPNWSLGALLVWGVCCGPVLAEPVLRHITAKVELDNSTDFKNIAGSTARSKEQTRQLSVTLDNRDREPAADVSVKWAIYAHKMDTNKLVTVKEGTLKVRIDGLSTASVKSDKVVIKGTPKHSVVTKRTVRGKVESSTKNEPGTGEEYYGYAVAVYAGSVLIEETSSQPSLKLTK